MAKGTKTKPHFNTFDLEKYRAVCVKCDISRICAPSGGSRVWMLLSSLISNSDSRDNSGSTYFTVLGFLWGKNLGKVKLVMMVWDQRRYFRFGGIVWTSCCSKEKGRPKKFGLISSLLQFARPPQKKLVMSRGALLFLFFCCSQQVEGSTKHQLFKREASNYTKNWFNWTLWNPLHSTFWQ